MRRILSLRYRVTVDGLENIANLQEQPEPTLVLPNHPAYVDPMIVQSYLRIAGTSRPLVYAGTFNRWFLRPLMRVLRAVEVPDLQKPNREAYRQTVSMIRNVVDGIEQGDSYLIYPSGRLQRGGIEYIGGARATSEIISRCANVQIVLVRIHGLWGSMFSCARTGEPPNLGRTILAAVAWLAAGGIFFCPRRPVHVSVQKMDHSSFSGLNRRTLNEFLEDWYNQKGEQEPRFVRYNWVIKARSRENHSISA